MKKEIKLHNYYLPCCNSLIKLEHNSLYKNYNIFCPKCCKMVRVELREET